MKRFVLLAAAALLGSGCIVHNDNTGGSCPPPTITVQWNTFTGGDNIARGCNAAGVASVDIFMDGANVSTWPCTDGGAVITNVPSGTHQLTVEGIEPSGRIAYRDQFNASAGACGDTLYNAQPAEGWLDVNYAFPAGGSCAGNPSYLWFSITDDIAGAVVARVDENSSPTQYVCGVYANPPSSIPPNALFLPLPEGTYHLNWIEERLPQSGVYVLSGSNCSPTPFSVAGGVFSNTVGVTLADAPPLGSAVACH
jgi:hypothetical protein